VLQRWAMESIVHQLFLVLSYVVQMRQISPN